jgi:hypothetical protein
MAPKIARASAIEPVFINSESTAGFYPSVTRKSNPPIAPAPELITPEGRREFIFKTERLPLDDPADAAVDAPAPPERSARR